MAKRSARDHFWRRGLLRPCLRIGKILNTSRSLFPICLILVSQTGAFAQGGIAEYEACKSEKTEADAKIFACSRVLGDTTQPPTIRVQALRGRASAYRARRDFQHAISDLTEALRLEPENADVLMARGMAYLKGPFPANPPPPEDWIEHAVSDYSEAIRLLPNSSGPYWGRAKAYTMKGAFDRAVGDYDEVLKLGVSKQALPFLFYERGHAKNLAKDFLGAISDFNEEVRLEGRNGEGHVCGTFNERGQAFEALGKKDDAIADYRREDCRATELSKKALQRLGVGR